MHKGSRTGVSEWLDTMVREYTGQSVRTISGKVKR